jgi:hypothetical protein
MSDSEHLGRPRTCPLFVGPRRAFLTDCAHSFYKIDNEDYAHDPAVQDELTDEHEFHRRNLDDEDYGIEVDDEEGDDNDADDLEVSFAIRSGHGLILTLVYMTGP